MKKKLTLRWVIIKLTGLLFALYSAYSVFTLFRDHTVLTERQEFISAAVALLFFVLAVYAWTSEVKNIRFRTARRITIIITLFAVLVFKLRMAEQVIAYFDVTKTHTVFYCISYVLSVMALLLLLVYCAFIRRKFLDFKRAAVVLPLLSAVFFLGSFLLETILFFVYGIGLEGNTIRTIVIRPVFYLSFIGLSVFFLFPLKPEDDPFPQTSDDDIIVTPVAPQQRSEAIFAPPLDEDIIIMPVSDQQRNRDAEPRSLEDAIIITPDHPLEDRGGARKNEAE